MARKAPDINMIGTNDLLQLKALGITETQVLNQLRLFKQGSNWLTLDRPCVAGDGIEKISAEEANGLIGLQLEAAHEGRFMKFVPASGAGSRMFSFVFEYSSGAALARRSDILLNAERGHKGAQQFLTFIDEISRFAFFDDLKGVMSQNSLELERLLEVKECGDIARFVLSEAGLDYQNIPKALVKFHRYPQASRTAFEEHLVEAVKYVQDRHSRARLHFTILPEQAEQFNRMAEQVMPVLEEWHGCCFAIDFSYQLPSSDTVAVDLDSQPFREKNGRLLFRPGGHGALLRNLNGLDADLVYIKNIDNVVPEHLMNTTTLWKRILGGYLVRQTSQINTYLERLNDGPLDRRLLRAATEFCRERLSMKFPSGFSGWSMAKQKSVLQRGLGRPVRVCGVVRNEGEPGGGPFWVRWKDGSCSRQIVESSQVNLNASDQRKIWESAPFFNPVDLVCSLRDYKDKKFNLDRYSDKRSYLVARKSHEGRDLKALEWPGLWNGGMARWLTFFVEVPIETFNPVKTVLDLLRPEHQPEQ
jgi:hypothetical protein